MQLPTFPLVDEILQSFAAALGGDLPGYRNHVYRVLNYFIAVTGKEAVPQAVLIAAAFHDLGIWTDHTFDYLEPSIRQARRYLATHDLESLEAEVHALILEHHKLRAYRERFALTVEACRKADLIDLSLGLVRFGVPASRIRSVKAALPDHGFHQRLVALTARQFLRNPLRPLPMLRW